MIDKIVRELKSAKSWSGGVREELLARKDSPEFPIPSLPVLNAKMWGLKRGLNIVAGRTSHAKSSWVKQVLFDLSKEMPVLLMSLEDDVPTMIETIFCQQKRINNYELLAGQFKHRKELQEAFDDFVANLPKDLLLTCRVGENFAEINKIIEVLNPKPRVVAIDYIQAIKTTRFEREEMNEYIRRFRELCVKNGICGILVSQINRMGVGEGAEPELHHLKSTGVLEEHADLVLILYWPYAMSKKQEDFNTFKINVAKNKRGRTGRLTVRYIPEHYLFEEPIEDWAIERKVKEVFGGQSNRKDF